MVTVARDTAIADRLRAAGLRVIEIDDWQVRGSTDFAPGGSVNHHTAGPSSGATPSLNTCIHGRPDLAGPLCNVFQSREPDGRDIAYVVAAGRANHAGEGGWRGLSGNRSVYGLEIEHTGTSTLGSSRQQIAARIHAAMFTGDPANVCQHREWAPSRKIDAAEDVDGDTFRELVAAAREGEEPQPEGGKVYVLMRGDLDPDRWWLTDFEHKREMRDEEEANFFVFVIRSNGGICADNDGKGPQVWPQAYVDAINRADVSNVNEVWTWWSAVQEGPAHDVIRQATGSSRER